MCSPCYCFDIALALLSLQTELDFTCSHALSVYAECLRCLLCSWLGHPCHLNLHTLYCLLSCWRQFRREYRHTVMCTVCPPVCLHCASILCYCHRLLCWQAMAACSCALKTMAHCWRSASDVSPCSSVQTDAPSWQSEALITFYVEMTI